MITKPDFTGEHLYLSDIAVAIDGDAKTFIMTGNDQLEFDKWATKPDGNGQDVTSSTDLLGIDANEHGYIVIYALWKTSGDVGTSCYGGENAENGDYGADSGALPGYPGAPKD